MIGYKLSSGRPKKKLYKSIIFPTKKAGYEAFINSSKKRLFGAKYNVPFFVVLLLHSEYTYLLSAGLQKLAGLLSYDLPWYNPSQFALFPWGNAKKTVLI